MEESDDLVPLSALQHYLYCPRQCALIHVERLWAENRQTAEGRLLHDRADTPQIERRHGVRTITAESTEKQNMENELPITEANSPKIKPIAEYGNRMIC